MEPLVETFAVHSYEVDAFGLLAAPALAGFLQEVAGHHADALGVGLEVLRAQGLTWVLARERIEVEAPPRLGDVLEIATWPSGIERLGAHREFEVRRSGRVVARATSVWFVLDLARRRPVRADRFLDPRLPREPGAHVVPLANEKLAAFAHWDFQKRFHVRYEDIDGNQHVTNASYLAWALEAIPRDVWQSSRVASLEVQFLAECGYGSAILSRLAPAGERAYSHALVEEEGGKELARVETRWSPR
jgi:acyl-ACP thioesterase